MLIARRITTVQSITRLPTSPRTIHTAMIRRKVSTGLLRASKSNSSLRSVAQVHAGSPSTQNAGFATSTLLSSQKNWTRETVVTLKSELKRRGLSQSGNKSDLVDRLKSFETSASLPPVPALTNSHRVQAPSSSHVRNLSTSSVRQRSTKVSGEKSDQEPVAPTSAPVTSTGPDVVSQKTEAPKKEELKPEELSVAPGLPETKSKGPAVKDSLDVRLPEPKAKQVPEQTIPVTPDNFREPKSEPEPEASSSAPKVSTASSPSTLPGGGPVHAVHDAIDPEAIDAAAKKAAQEFPSFVASVGSVLQAPGKAFKSSGLSTSLLPEIGPAKGFASGGKEYKASDKPLNAEEKRGAWVLGGIVALGLLLGGGKKDKKDSKSNHGSHATGSASGSSKPKGDATWEKASGAGIVGHGARKD